MRAIQFTEFHFRISNKTVMIKLYDAAKKNSILLSEFSCTIIYQLITLVNRQVTNCGL